MKRLFWVSTVLWPYRQAFLCLFWTWPWTLLHYMRSNLSSTKHVLLYTLYVCVYTSISVNLREAFQVSSVAFRFEHMLNFIHQYIKFCILVLMTFSFRTFTVTFTFDINLRLSEVLLVKTYISGLLRGLHDLVE